jgi:hypothetical protein
MENERMERSVITADASARSSHNASGAEHSNGSASTLSSLVRDILEDFRTLFEQQLALLRQEVKRDFTKVKAAAVMLAAGIGGLVLGALLLLLMLVHGVNSATELPLWACYGIVGAVLAIGGAAAAAQGKKKLETVDPLHQETAQALKETVQCLTNPK